MSLIAPAKMREPPPPGGTRKFCLEVAGIRLAFECDRGETRFAVAGAARRFLTGDGRADVTLRAAWGELSTETPGELVFDSGALWRLYRDGGDYLLRFATPFFGETPYKVARLDANFSAGEVLIHRPYFEGRGPVNPLEYPLDELLMSNLLAAGRGVELHSCGVRDPCGRGLLFVGQSGAGKTTTARLWGVEPSCARVLSDDRVVVRRREGGDFLIHGTPWHGEAGLSSNESAPLAALFFLRHAGAEGERLSPLPRAEAAARLLACGFPPFHDPRGLDFTLAFHDALTSAVPSYELSFRPGPAAVELARRALANI